MSTRTFARMSRLSRDALDALRRIDRDVSELWCAEIKAAGRLAPSDDSLDAGLELAGEMAPCDSVPGAVRGVGECDSLAVSYSASEPRAWYELYFFDILETSFASSVDVDSAIVYYASDEFPCGRWLEGLLTSVAVALRPQVLGYGTHRLYQPQHAALDCEEVLSLVRSGELLDVPRPTFHAISDTLISHEELESLVAQHRASHLTRSVDLRHALGYHLLGRVNR